VSAEQTAYDLFPFRNRSGDQSASVAALIAELVRLLNHATVTSREAEVSLPTPQDAARVIAGLASAVGRMPQLVQQINDRLDALEEQVEDVQRRPAHQTLQIINQELAAAFRPLTSAAGALDRARSSVERLVLIEEPTP
jgi:hypothetical protein